MSSELKESMQRAFNRRRGKSGGWYKSAGVPESARSKFQKAVQIVSGRQGAYKLAYGPGRLGG